MSLQEKVKQAGVIGAGGAGFPTHAKLGAKAEFILLNGAECEPLLRVDQQLMAKYPEQVVQGLYLAGQAVGAQKAIIGIKEKHNKVIDILNQAIQQENLVGKVEVKPLRDMYPAGDEQVLVYELTGRIVPELSIPLTVGCVVVNTETALNIFAADKSTPVTDTYITVTGDVPTPITVKVPVGVSIRSVLELSGIQNFEEYYVIDGGPMMGSVMDTIEGYVTKKSKGYVILPKTHPLMRKKTLTLEQASRISKATCEQCRMCTDLCPRYLLGHDIQPHKSMRALAYKHLETDAKLNAQLCCECGVCQLFACPVNLQPKQINMLFKQQSMAEKQRYQPKEKQYKTRSMRENRFIPSKRLVAKLGLTKFDVDAPFIDNVIKPSEIHIALRQHIGAAAVPVVSKGQTVNKGQLIGDIPADALGAPVHASMPGIVSEITANEIVIKVDSYV